MYSEALAASSSQGIILSILIVAAAYGAYFMLSKRPEIFGALLLMCVAAFMARDYYHIVYGAGAMIALYLLMYITQFDEGTIRESFFFAGIGLFISLIMYYIMPITIKGDINSVFIIAIIPAVIITLIEGFKGGFSYDSEATIAIIAAFVIAFLIVSHVGITHMAWGIAIMVLAVVLRLTVGGILPTTAFLSGFLIWLDDAVAYTLYNQNQHALTLLTPIGVAFIAIYLFILWRD